MGLDQGVGDGPTRGHRHTGLRAQSADPREVSGGSPEQIVRTSGHSSENESTLGVGHGGQGLLWPVFTFVTA